MALKLATMKRKLAKPPGACSCGWCHRVPEAGRVCRKCLDYVNAWKRAKRRES
jgi:hypothetical protein